MKRPDEMSYEDYCRYRKGGNIAIKEHLKGTLISIGKTINNGKKKMSKKERKRLRREL